MVKQLRYGRTSDGSDHEMQCGAGLLQATWLGNVGKCVRVWVGGACGDEGWT